MNIDKLLELLDTLVFGDFTYQNGLDQLTDQGYTIKKETIQHGIDQGYFIQIGEYECDRVTMFNLGDGFFYYEY